MKYTLLYIIAALLLPFSTASAQLYTKPCTDKKLVKEAKKWAKKGKWRNGFKTASPDETVNLVEFYTQYQKNPQQWDAMFKWLAEHDLTTIEKGKHPIEGTNLVVSVEDSNNEPEAKRRSESHYHHIDFQWVVKGTERFAILDHETSKPNTVYRPDVIHYAYEKDKTKYFEPAHDKFVLFFPYDWHVAKIANDTDDQVIRVIVVKLDYAEEETPKPEHPGIHR